MVAKDRMNKKNKQGAAFTDDGFSMGALIHTCTHTQSELGENNIFSVDNNIITLYPQMQCFLKDHKALVLYYVLS